jgi:DNA-binding transcriptional LysR family regulator
VELKWLEDLIALADSETLTRAAETRNVTQPAFSRRLRALEDWLGAPVADRSHKPARVTPAVRSQIETVRTLVHNLHLLRSDIQAAESNQRRLVIAAQHTISVFYLPSFFTQFRDIVPATAIRLRSANRDECRTMLMSREVMIIVTYETPRLPLATDETLMEKARLGCDRLLPVARPGTWQQGRASAGRLQALPIISYPIDVFLGAVLHHDILPPLAANHRISIACETALVPAVVELALAGVGVAWLPRSVVARSLAVERLEDLSPLLGSHAIEIVSARLRTPRSEFADSVWAKLKLFAAKAALARGN